MHGLSTLVTAIEQDEVYTETCMASSVVKINDPTVRQLFPSLSCRIPRRTEVRATDSSGSRTRPRGSLLGKSAASTAGEKPGPKRATQHCSTSRKGPANPIPPGATSRGPLLAVARPAQNDEVLDGAANVLVVGSRSAERRGGTRSARRPEHPSSIQDLRGQLRQH